MSETKRKIALVTGASRGIGRAIAIELAKTGAFIIVNYSSSPEAAQETLNAIRDELVTDSLVYRYNPELAADDGLSGEEGTFSICSFWWVEALARAGNLEEARLAFEKMHTYANHLGLYSEEIGPSGEALGNFPQAFTHLSLVSAALYLDRALDNHRARVR